MEYAEVTKRLAPCGLSCAKCFAFKDGEPVWFDRQTPESPTFCRR